MLFAFYEKNMFIIVLTWVALYNGAIQIIREEGKGFVKVETKIFVVWSFLFIFITNYFKVKNFNIIWRVIMLSSSDVKLRNMTFLTLK
jgi:hypothetical protein